MTRSEVADVLGVSEKTVARYVAAGRLPARYVRGKTGQQLNVDEADVMRLKTEMETPVEVSTASPPPAIQSAPNTTEPESVLARVLPAATENAIAPAPAMTLSALARIVRAVMEEEGQPGQAGTKGDKVQVPVESKLLLSLDEAVALSGVPRSQLNAARREGQLEARRIGPRLQSAPRRSGEIRRLPSGKIEQTDRTANSMQ